MEKIRVKLYRGNVAGDLAEVILRSLPNVELVDVVTESGSTTKLGWAEEFDILFSASYPKRITQEQCREAKWGAVNIHTGLLPKQRGIHPINWALIWDDHTIGVTIHKIVDSFDAGDICLQQEIDIERDDTVTSVKDKCFSHFRPLITEFFTDPIKYLEEAWMQDQSQATYAPKRLPEDSQLNMDALPWDIYNLYRSCDPELYPAFFIQDGVKYIVDEMKITWYGRIKMKYHADK